MAAIDWLADACAAAGPGCKCLDSGLRTAVFCAADKSNEVRKAGDALMAQLLQVRMPGSRQAHGACRPPQMLHQITSADMLHGTRHPAAVLIPQSCRTSGRWRLLPPRALSCLLLQLHREADIVMNISGALCQGG